MSTINLDQLWSNSDQCAHYVYNTFRSNADQCTSCLHYITFRSNSYQCAHYEHNSIKETNSNSKRLKATQIYSKQLNATQSYSKRLKETLIHNLVVKDFKRILNLVYLHFKDIHFQIHFKVNMIVEIVFRIIINQCPETILV